MRTGSSITYWAMLHTTPVSLSFCLSDWSNSSAQPHMRLASCDIKARQTSPLTHNMTSPGSPPSSSGEFQQGHPILSGLNESRPTEESCHLHRWSLSLCGDANENLQFPDPLPLRVMWALISLIGHLSFTCWYFPRESQLGPAYQHWCLIKSAGSVATR